MFYFFFRRLILIISILFIYFSNLHAIFTTQIIDARSAGTGGIGVLNKSIWSNFSNQGGLDYVKSFTGALHIENRFLLKEMSSKAFAVAMPTAGGTFGFNYNYFGYSKYNESKAGLAYGKKIGDYLSAGIQLNYHYVYIAENYGNRGKVSVEGGLIAEPVSNLIIGFHLFNPSHIKIQSDYSEYIPTIVRAGIGYQFFDQTFVCFETEKESEKKEIYKAGIEHMVYDFIYLRIGGSSLSSQYTFGIGFEFGTLLTDIAFMSHRELGYSPHISITYAFE